MSQAMTQSMRRLKNNKYTCLFTSPTSNNDIIIENEILKMEGCYLFYDSARNEYARSSKASRELGDSFQKRFEDYQKVSHLTTLKHRTSLFYLLYPAGKKGLKENMKI